ncbi:hypothetical protein [Dactylosporangium sp. NPDC048998]|uniref:hypothetical protein n=1 Tax=Dactylosporangium sp. NPDC048998 TaxID=3363976 RepID=UPI00371C8A31
MGTRELAELLEQASADVGAPALAEAAWARAGRVRRRRRILTGAAAVVAVCAVTVGVAVPLRGGPRPHPAATPTSGPAPSAAPLGPPRVDQMPQQPGRRTIGPLPATGAAFRPAEARMLSQRPVRRAVAVVEPGSAENATRPEPLYVLDTDGSWARVDVVDLAFTRDSGNNTADPLRPTAVSPDRRLVAVAQTDEVVVVDVTTAAVYRTPLPGFNEQVMWRSDDTVLVTRDAGEQATATFAVDWRARTATRVAAGLSVWNTVVSRPDGPVLELRGTLGGEAGDEPLVLKEWQLDRAAPVREVPVDGRALAPYGVDEWYGPALRNGPDAAGDLVVRAGWGRTPAYQGIEVVAVVDVRTGVLQRLLDLGRDRWKGCCQPLDWVDERTVLLRTEREGLVAWDVSTGAVSVVSAGQLPGTVAIALR